MTTLPLHDCRVLDLGIITAGAATSALLADLGAEVIKVESPRYHDPFRVWTAGDPALPARGMPPFFRATNRNKASISLDLKHAAGRAVFLRLVANSDVVVENFRRGVLGRLGLDYETLRAANADIILASVSSQGETGPDAGYVSYGSTLEAVGGLAWLTGYAGGEPVVSGRDVNYPDQVVAIFAAGMIATAWRARRNGAGGVHLDISQRELTSFLCGESFLSAGTTGRESGRLGNMQPPHRIQDCFRDADGKWVAVTVDDAGIVALRRLLGVPLQGPDTALKDELARWLSVRRGDAGVEALAATGIAAAMVLDGSALWTHQDTLWDTALVRMPDGVLKGFPFQLAEAPLTLRCDAPEAGADTATVLMRVAGYSPDEVAALLRDSVIGVPDGQDRSSPRARRGGDIS